MRRLALALSTWFLIATSPAIADDKTFSITTEPFPPYIGNDFDNQGWTMEVARAALEPMGYEVKLELRPWARAVADSKAGKFDGLYLSYYVEDRKKWYVYSDPIGTARTGFFKLKERDIDFESLEDLKDLRIGLTRGASVSPEFDEAGFLNKQETTDDVQNLKKLLVGRIDLYAGPEAVAQHLINERFSPEQREKFEFMEPPLTTNDLHMAISKNAPGYREKLADFNTGLARIKADGTYDEILRSHGF